MLKQQLISSKRYSIKCPHTMKAEGITIHNTFNDASAKNEAAYMERNDNQVSFHIVVDDKEALQLIPFNRNAWHAGDGGNGKGNRRYIALEICYSKSGGERFKKAEERAAKEVAALLKEFKWGIDKVKAHRDFSKKDCPHRTNMSNFKKLAEKELKILNNSSSNSSKPPTSKLKVGDRVKITGSKYATGEKVSDWAKKQIHTISKIQGDRALLKEINSWCYLKDLQLTTSSKKLSVGMYVQMIGSKWATGQSVPSWVKNNKYKVKEIKADKALLDSVMSWAYIKDLKY